MIFDDHDVHDDWNTSAAWVAAMRSPSRGGRSGSRRAIATYWLYQHLGNLSPDARAERPAAPGAARPRTTRSAARVRRPGRPARSRACCWSFWRDLGRSAAADRFDSRGGRVLDGHARRWSTTTSGSGSPSTAAGDSTTWCSASRCRFCSRTACTAWRPGTRPSATAPGASVAARSARRLRRALDLEHWAAFGDSFRMLGRLLTEVADGRRGKAPATVLVLSGDVHYSYLAAVKRKGTPLVQITCSPLRNPIERKMRLLGRFATSPVGTAVGRTLARLARVPEPELDWRIDRGPWFDNVIATLDLHGREAVFASEDAAGRRRRSAARARLRAAARLATSPRRGSARSASRPRCSAASASCRA